MNVLNRMNLNIAKAALAPARTMNEKGYSLGVKPGTALEGLLYYVYPLADTQGDLKSSMESIVEDINAPTITGKSTYEEGIMGIVPEIAAKLNEHLSFCRNVIIPKVEELATRVEKELASTNASSLLRFKVVAEKLPKAMQDTDVVEGVSRWAAESLDTAPLSMKVHMGEYTEDELLGFIATGNTRVDAKIRGLVESNPGTLQRIYDGLFRRQTFNNVQQLFGGVIAFKGLSPEDSDSYAALIAYLLAQHFVHHTDDKANANYTEYLDYITGIRGQAALKIKSISTRFNSTVDNGILITRIDDKTIFVNGDVYKTYLDEGGVVDAVLANALLDTPYRRKSEIVEHQEELVKRWQQHAMVVSNTDSLIVINHAKRIYVEEWRKMIQEELAAQGENANFDINGILEVARTVVNQLPGKILTDDIYTAALYVISRSRYLETDCEQTISSIQEVSEKHPGIEPKEAALLAAISYVCDWVANQFQIIRN